MDKNKVLEMQLDFLKGTDISKEGLQAQEVLESGTVPSSAVEKDASAHAENDLQNKKLQERIERSMDAIKQFIRNIDINSL
ncbi:MAG: hypothetical protein WHS46_08295 [Desulfosoma sp.]